MKNNFESYRTSSVLVYQVPYDFYEKVKVWEKQVRWKKQYKFSNFGHLFVVEFLDFS